MSKEKRKRLLKKFSEMPVLAAGDGPGPSCLANTVDSCISPTGDGTKLPATLNPLSTVNSQAQLESVSQPTQATILFGKLSALSGKLGLPNAAIDGIARKAAEILCTDGAIVHAPGHSTDARMVISRSGKRPHLVLPKRKSAGMTCDDDCPQYKSAKLCSHTVAVAEYNKKLDQFIQSYKGIKKNPNLTKLVTTDMPKGRGRKGSKGPLKRKSSLPIENRLELNEPALESPTTTTTATTFGMEVHVSPSIAPVYQPSINAPISVTIGASSPQLGAFSPCTSTIFPVMSPTMLFGHDQLQSPYPSFYPPMYSTPYPLSSPYVPTPASSYCGLDPTNGGAHPFRIHFISGNISVCNGCKGKYDKKVGPPNNICVQHEEWRTFTPQGSSDKQSRFGNVYYHCNITCIMAIWPSFIPSTVVVPVEVQTIKIAART